MIQKSWNKLSIKTKLMLIFSLIIVFLSLLNLYTLNNAFRYMDIYADELKKTSNIHKLEKLIDECRAYFEDYTANYNSEAFQLHSELIPKIWVTWNDVLESSRNNQYALFQISAIRYGFIAYVETAQKVMLFRDQSEEEFVSNLLKSRRLTGYIDSYLTELLKVRLEEGSRIHAIQLSKVGTIRLISFFGAGFIVILFLFFGNLFSESLTRPIRLLADRSTKMAEGELSTEDLTLPVTQMDETGILTRSFNRMSRKIQEMVKSLEDKVEMERILREDELKIAEMHRSLKEAQFLSLQSQISPHFLFNTLNTISRTSMFEKAPETVKLIECLSNVFRYTLKDQNLIVSLAEEIKILEEYIHIQRSRYGKRLEFITEFLVPLEDVKLPIFTIQPLVENSIKYGIETLEEGGKITLKAESKNDKIHISITDTGNGMNKDILARINNAEKASVSQKSAGIGIYNVKRRLNLAYNYCDEFKIESTLGKGTTITIIIPENIACIEY